MRIRRLQLHDLQRHQDLDLALAPGLTVIRGANESGKTTIQRAIELALFRRATAGGAEMERLRRWGTDGADPRIELEFETDDGVGQLTKQFAGARGQARLTLDGVEITDPATVDARLAELTGLPSEKFFRSTASVHHHELDDLDRDESALRDRLQMSMSGADKGTSAARKKLQDALRRFESEGNKNPGLLKQDRDAEVALAEQVTAGQAALDQLARDQAALSGAREAFAQAEARLLEARGLLERSEQAVALAERGRDAQERYERYRRAAELRDRIAELERTHPSQTALPVLRTAVTHLRDGEKRISEINAELAGQPDVSGYDVGQLPTPGWRRWAVVGLLLAVVGLFIALSGTLASYGTAGGYAGLGLAGLGLLCIVVAIVRQRRGRDVRRQNVLREEQIARRLRGRSELEQELKDAAAARDAQLADIEQPDTPTAEALLEAESKHVAAIDQLQAEFKGVLGDEQPQDDVARLRDAAAAEAEQARHALAGMGEIGSDPVRARDRARTEVQRFEHEREEALTERTRAQAAVEQNPVDAEKVAGLAEELEATRARRAAHERRHRIVRTTLETLDAAEQATMKAAARFLEQHMARDVAALTAGRYREVRVDEAQLAISVRSPERGDWVDVWQLSQGTLDAFYLAARLGLVRQVTQGQRPPLIFDDPFLTFDAARAHQALTLLREMARDHQVIYLTTSDRYDADADAVIELPAPAPVTEAVGGPEAAAGTA